MAFEDTFEFNQFISEDTEFIPLMSSEDEKQMNEEQTPDELPILPLKNTVLFPGVVIPITAGRDKSVQLIQEANRGNKIIGVVAQHDESIENPGENDIHRVGTVARILRLFKMPDGNITVIIQGKKRFDINAITATEPYIKAQVSVIEDKKVNQDAPKFLALMDSIREVATTIVKESPNIPTEASFALKNIESNSFLVNFISSNLNLDVEEKQKLLEENSLTKRANDVLRHLTQEMQMLEVKNQIQSKVKTEFDQQQREYFLQQQMKTIQEELGGGSSEKEIEDMRQRAKKKKWSKETQSIFDKELLKLQRMNPQVPEHGIQRNYLEFMLDLPWNQYSKDNFSLSRAEKVLNRDHYGLEDVKDRIIEHLAVLKLKGDLRAPIICLVGPPGVGKTSLGKSIAEALGRKYARMSLGGLRDEAEIRGHRKTYIGAMPGRLLQLIKKSGSGNPVMVLDEIDKLARDAHGDPSSAMLEVLDPEQNVEFYDNYLEMGYDLSKVLFIATANSLATIQPALRDRMEIIEMSGYTIEEKVQIAKRHLLPDQLKEHGLDKKAISLSTTVLQKITEHYTRESGVRGLNKVMAKLARKIARLKADDGEFDGKLTWEKAQELLGIFRYKPNEHERQDLPGVVAGLAWTPVGGDILYIESIISKGSGKLNITGNLGDVMKESATIARAWLRANAEIYGIPEEAFTKYDVHIHVPEGATPKDGPSAGITMLTALASTYTQRKIKPSIAMTGEMTLRGKVLPVGGIKEKILAAKRAGVKEIILCEDNRKDVDDIKADYLKGLSFTYVTEMREVLDAAMLEEKVADARTFEG
ncbi:MAG: endopeptidase La [Cryomorphaceae bacterium]|nr:endopeptidase La [Cryomorphaceae bacterium]